MSSLTTRFAYYLGAVQLAFAMAQAQQMPGILVGKIEMTSSQDPQQTSNIFVSSADGSFTGWGTGTWPLDSSGSNFHTYYGKVTRATCTGQAPGVMTTMQQMWSHSMKYDEPEMGRVACSYQTWDSASKQLTNIQYDDSTLRSVKGLRAGYFPGNCPLLESEARAGIAWFSQNFQRTEDSALYECKEGCQATCALQDHGIAGVTMPAAFEGTWEDSVSQSSPDFARLSHSITDGQYTGFYRVEAGGQMQDGAFYGTYQSVDCSVLPDGRIAIATQVWEHSSSSPHDEVTVVCRYFVGGDHSQISEARILDGRKYSESDLRAGTNLPGACPTTMPADATDIAWMQNAQKVDGWPVWSCTAGCGAFTCSTPSTGTCSTCAAPVQRQDALVENGFVQIAGYACDGNEHFVNLADAQAKCGNDASCMGIHSPHCGGSAYAICGTVTSPKSQWLCHPKDCIYMKSS